MFVMCMVSESGGSVQDVPTPCPCICPMFMASVCPVLSTPTRGSGGCACVVGTRKRGWTGRPTVLVTDTGSGKAALLAWQN